MLRSRIAGIISGLGAGTAMLGTIAYTAKSAWPEHANHSNNLNNPHNPKKSEHAKREWPEAAENPEGAAVYHASAGTITAVAGRFNYQAPSVESSLVRNGKVGTKRGADGGDSRLFGTDWCPTQVPVLSARPPSPLHPSPSLAAEGFELRHHDSGEMDLRNEEHIVHQYYPSVCELVKQATGATRVVAFDHNVRCASGQAAGAQIKGGSSVQGPAHLVHTDYTTTSAPTRLAQLAQPARLNDTWGPLVGEGQPLVDPEEAARALAKGGRFAIINTWRNIQPEPIEKFPLAVCSAKTVTTEDLITFEIHYADRIGENYFSKPSSGHRWYYYPAMQQSEMLLFKQWDSAGRIGLDESGPPVFCLHSAFDDPSSPPDARDRESIEVRCIALFD